MKRSNTIFLTKGLRTLPARSAHTKKTAAKSAAVFYGYTCLVVVSDNAVAIIFDGFAQSLYAYHGAVHLLFRQTA